MWTKLYIGILLVSILGLGFVLHQNTEKKSVFEGRILQTMKNADAHYTIASSELLNAIRQQASGYSQFRPLEEEAFMIIDSTNKQTQNLDKNNK